MALQLRNRGIERVRPLVGGYAAWLKLGYATWIPGTPLQVDEVVAPVPEIVVSEVQPETPARQHEGSAPVGTSSSSPMEEASSSPAAAQIRCECELPKEDVPES